MIDAESLPSILVGLPVTGAATLVQTYNLPALVALNVNSAIPELLVSTEAKTGLIPFGAEYVMLAGVVDR